MRIRRLCLINIGVGLLAGAAVSWLRLPVSPLSRAVFDGSVPLNRLLEPIEATILVIGVGGTIFATAHLALALRKARSRAASLLLRAPAQPRSASEWDNMLRPISTHFGGQDQIPPRGKSLHDGIENLQAIAPRIARTELLGLHWWYVRKMQVGTAIALLLVGGILAVGWWRLSPDSAVAIAILRSIGPGILTVLSLIVLTRFQIAGRIDRFIDASNDLPTQAADQRKHGSSLRQGTVDIGQRATVLPTEIHPLTLSVRADAGVRDRGSGATDAPSRLVRSGASTTGVPDETLTSTYKRSPPPSDGKSLAATDLRLSEVCTAIENLSAQQNTIRDLILALRDTLRGIAEQKSDLSHQADTANNWLSRGHSLVEKVIEAVQRSEKRLDGQLAALVSEVRERDEAQAHKIVDLCASLNRIEARIIPALHQASTARQAMTLLADRLAQVNQHFVELGTMKLESSLEPPLILAAPEAGKRESNQAHDIAAELRRLMLELEDATTDIPHHTGGG